MNNIVILHTVSSEPSDVNLMKDLSDDDQIGDRFMNNVQNVEKIEGTRASHKIDR
jgi:hypothetical protein